MGIINGKLRKEATRLRKEGKTYLEIASSLGMAIPKSTLSYWCNKIILSPKAKKRLEYKSKVSIQKARSVALKINKERREIYLQSVIERNRYLQETAQNKDTAKLMLAMLYLGEGGKTPQRASVLFGNADPVIISLFLKLLRYCYDIDENKFRCTLQCRADQNIRKLEKFWSKTTRISPNQFYKARIDLRSIGKPTKKSHYKGVCRIDYFSADIFTELTKIAELVCNKGP